MKKTAVFCLLMLFVAVLGCNRKPTVPEIFKTQLMKFLEEGSKTNAKASQGVSFMEYREQVANTKAAYDMISSTWPKTLSAECRGDFEKAIKAWNLTLNLWQMKINASDEPVEPDVNGFAAFAELEGERLVTKFHGGGFPVWAYKNKKYLPFDENIIVLLTIGGESFNSGRDKILKELQ